MMELSFLIVVAFAIYGSCLHGESQFDDITQIQNNPLILEGKWKEALFDNAVGWRNRLRSLFYGWRSIVRATFALNVAIWGPSTFSIHATSVMLHALNGFVQYHIFMALGFDRVSSLLSATLLIGHPLAVSSVAYMSSRGGVLSALFSNCAILMVVSGLNPVFALPVAVLAFMAKEDAAVTPLALTLIGAIQGLTAWWLPLPFMVAILWKRRKGIRDLVRNNGNAGMTKVGFRSQFEQPWYSITAFTETAVRFPQWVLGNALNFDPKVERPSAHRIALAVGIAVAIGAGFILGGPLVKIGLILTVCTPPLVYLVAQMPDPIMEYRFYSALTGIGVGTAWLFSVLPGIFVFIAIVWFWTLAAFRAFDWSSSLALWRGVIRDGTNSERAWINLGAAYMVRQQHKDARECFHKVLEINPGIGPAWANLGQIEAAYQNWDKAIEYYSASTKHNPAFAASWHALAEIYQRLNKPDLAAATMRGMQSAVKG